MLRMHRCRVRIDARTDAGNRRSRHCFSRETTDVRYDNPVPDDVRLHSDRHSLLAENDLLRERLAAAEAKAENLEIALQSSRVIGAATGILMIQRSLTRDDAFDLLRRASQTANVKIRDLAEHVLYTGTLAPHDPA